MYLLERVAIAHVADGSNVPATEYTGSAGISNAPVQFGTTKLNLYGFTIYNPNATTVFLKFWNSAFDPEVGVDTPKMVFAIEGLKSKEVILPIILMNFPLKAWAAVTTGYLDNNAVAAAISPTATFFYKQ